MKLTILGNGGFGTALAILADATGHAVRLWGHDPAYTAELAATRRNPRYLAVATLPASVAVTADAATALDGAELILAAIPTQHVRSVLAGMGTMLPRGVPIVSLAKGLEQASGKRPSEVIAEVTGGRSPVLVLSGPSHAEEIAEGKPATLVLAADAAQGATCLRLQEALSSPRFRIYRNTDVLGVELCGALKNVIAIAAGIADGLGYGDNAKAAVLTRGLVEMVRYGEVEGAQRATFYGLAGIGDLAVTAFSRHGRNRAFGERVGKGERADAVLASSRKVVEGAWTSRAVRARARARGIAMPLTDAVCGVLFEAVPAEAAVRALMLRDPKDEAP